MTLHTINLDELNDMPPGGSRKVIAAATDAAIEHKAENKAELLHKLDQLRLEIPFRGMQSEDLAPFRLLGSIRKDAERLIEATKIGAQAVLGVQRGSHLEKKHGR